MRVAGNALLLREAEIGAPLQRVIPQLLGPVVNDLEMVLGLFERAVALIDSERVAEIESAVAVDIKSRHAASLGGSGVEAGNAGIRGRGGSYSVGLNANTIAVKPEAHICLQACAECMVHSDRGALIAIDRIAGEAERRRAAGEIAECRGRVVVEVGERVPRKDVIGREEVGVHAAV